MRTYGRVYQTDGSYYWATVTTDPAGFNDLVWVTTLAQTLLLNLGESPFFANYGIPAHQTIMTQIFPDFYIIQTQQQYAQHFASLIVSRQNDPAPVYRMNITTNQGAKLNPSVPIPY